MYRRILVGYDGSEQARDALLLAAHLATATDASLTVARVFPAQPAFRPGAMADAVPGWDSALRRTPLEELERVAEGLGAAARAVPSSSAARGLHELAESEQADLIVIGSCHRGRLGRVFLGSVGHRLLHGSPCPVAVAPAGYADHDGSISRLFVGYDGSAEARIAMDGAKELGRDTGAPVETVTVDVGDPAAELARAAGEPGALLVVGSRGYGPVRRVLLGPVSAKLLNCASSPVLVFPRGDAAPADQVRLPSPAR